MLASLRPAAGVSVIFLDPARPGLPAGRDRHRAGSFLPSGQRIADRRRLDPDRPGLDRPALVPGPARRRQPDGHRRHQPRPAVEDPRHRPSASRSPDCKPEGITPTSDLVTTSGSGVDPDISPADAYAQVSTVARRAAAGRRVTAAGRRAHRGSRSSGSSARAYVNVLQLNEALAGLRWQPAGTARGHSHRTAADNHRDRRGPPQDRVDRDRHDPRGSRP